MFTGPAAGALSGVSPTDEGKEDAHQREEEEVEDSRPCKTKDEVTKFIDFNEFLPVHPVFKAKEHELEF